MPIKPSSQSEIKSLLLALGAADDVARESAVARLAVIGGRAVDRLASAYAAADTTREVRVAILRVFERMGDGRAIPIAREALLEGGDVAVAAAGALRPLLDATGAEVAAQALDAVMSVATDREAERRVRLAAVEALQDLPADVRGRVAALAEDLNQPAAAGTLQPSRGAAEDEAIWQDALGGHLPDDPNPLRKAAESRAATAPLGLVQKLVDATRQRQEDTREQERAREWRALRGALHQALALRGSTVAIYDLRETLDRTTEPLPPTYLAALQVIGDESCLESIAAAYSRAGSDERWQHQLAAALQAIVTREKISRTSSVLKRIAARWPDAVKMVSKTSRTTPRRKTPGRT